MRMLVVMVVAMVVVMMVIVVVMVMTVTIEEFRLDLQDAIEIEGVAPQHLRQRDLAALGLVHPGVGVDAANAGLDLAELVRLHQIGLVEQDDVGEGDLVLRLGRILEPLLQPLGVGHRHDCVELGLATDVLVHEEGLRHRRGISEARWSPR